MPDGKITVTRLHPSELPRNPAFSPGVSVDGPARTIYVGGQNAVRADGTIAGDDAGSQTRQALVNVEIVLAEAGAALTDVVHWRIALVQGAAPATAFGAFQKFWARRGEPPAISVDVVAGLANPAFLVEITAIAAVSA
jgi:enamine deaminase RidA (YjgF/YER057c/UK114 family)